MSKILEDKKTRKTKYDINYRKQHKVQFNVDINKSEMNSLNELLKTTNSKKSDFFEKTY